MRLPGDYEVLS